MEAIAGGDKLGPDLYGVTNRHDESWPARWLKLPEQMMQSDPTARALLDKWKLPMPNQRLGDKEIRPYVNCFKGVDKNLQPRSKEQSQPSAAGRSLPPSQTKSAATMPRRMAKSREVSPPTRVL